MLSSSRDSETARHEPYMTVASQNIASGSMLIVEDAKRVIIIYGDRLDSDKRKPKQAATSMMKINTDESSRYRETRPEGAYL